jgi:hypothetical protein
LQAANQVLLLFGPIIKNISQSEAFMAPGSHVGYPIVTKVTTLG